MRAVRDASARRIRLTLSNGLSVIRLISAPAFYFALTGDAWTLACLLFWTAVATDWLDGRIARVRGESSAFGGLLDHASDALFVSLGLCALAVSGRVTPWLPGLVGAAFLQYVLDSRALDGRRLRTSALGRWNGILYFAPSGLVVSREAFGLAGPPDEGIAVLGWILVLSTLLSMIDRAWTLLSGEEAGPPSDRS